MQSEQHEEDPTLLVTQVERAYDRRDVVPFLIEELLRNGCQMNLSQLGHNVRLPRYMKLLTVLNSFPYIFQVTPDNLICRLQPNPEAIAELLPEELLQGRQVCAGYLNSVCTSAECPAFHFGEPRPLLLKMALSSTTNSVLPDQVPPLKLDIPLASPSNPWEKIYQREELMHLSLQDLKQLMVLREIETDSLFEEKEDFVANILSAQRRYLRKNSTVEDSSSKTKTTPPNINQSLSSTARPSTDYLHSKLVAKPVTQKDLREKSSSITQKDLVETPSTITPKEDAGFKVDREGTEKGISFRSPENEIPHTLSPSSTLVSDPSSCNAGEHAELLPSAPYVRQRTYTVAELNSLSSFQLEGILRQANKPFSKSEPTSCLIQKILDYQSGAPDIDDFVPLNPAPVPQQYTNLQAERIVERGLVSNQRKKSTFEGSFFENQNLADGFLESSTFRQNGFSAPVPFDHSQDFIPFDRSSEDDPGDNSPNISTGFFGQKEDTTEGLYPNLQQLAVQGLNLQPPLAHIQNEDWHKKQQETCLRSLQQQLGVQRKKAKEQEKQFMAHEQQRLKQHEEYWRVQDQITEQMKKTQEAQRQSAQMHELRQREQTERSRVEQLDLEREARLEQLRREEETQRQKEELFRKRLEFENQKNRETLQRKQREMLQLKRKESPRQQESEAQRKQEELRKKQLGTQSKGLNTVSTKGKEKNPDSFKLAAQPPSLIKLAEKKASNQKEMPLLQKTPEKKPSLKKKAQDEKFKKATAELSKSVKIPRLAKGQLEMEEALPPRAILTRPVSAQFGRDIAKSIDPKISSARPNLVSDKERPEIFPALFKTKESTPKGVPVTTKESNSSPSEANSSSDGSWEPIVSVGNLFHDDSDEELPLRSGHTKKIALSNTNLFLTAKGMNSTAKRMNSTAKGMNSTAKGMNSTAKGMNSTEKAMNSTAKGINSTTKGINSTEKGMNSTTKSGKKKRESVASSDPTAEIQQEERRRQNLGARQLLELEQQKLQSDRERKRLQQLDKEQERLELEREMLRKERNKLTRERELIEKERQYRTSEGEPREKNLREKGKEIRQQEREKQEQERQRQKEKRRQERERQEQERLCQVASVKRLVDTCEHFTRLQPAQPVLWVKFNNRMVRITCSSRTTLGAVKAAVTQNHILRIPSERDFDLEFEGRILEDLDHTSSAAYWDQTLVVKLEPLYVWFRKIGASQIESRDVSHCEHVMDVLEMLIETGFGATVCSLEVRGVAIPLQDRLADPAVARLFGSSTRLNPIDVKSSLFLKQEVMFAEE